MTEAGPPIASLMTLMREFGDIMRAEDTLLREMNLQGWKDLQSQKSRLTELYELEMHRVRADPDFVTKLDGGDRSLLESSTREFRNVLRRNTARIAQARNVVDGLIRALQADPAVAGDRAPYAGAGARVDGGRAIAVAFDRKF